MPRQSQAARPIRPSSLRMDDANVGDSELSASRPVTKSFACYNCATRKTKCDKERPICSSCRQRQLACIYENAAAAGSRKRKVTEDANGRLKRVERILIRHGLTTDDARQPETNQDIAKEASAEGLAVFPAGFTTSTGRLIVDENNKNNSRYINSALWREAELRGLGKIFEEEALNRAAELPGSADAFPQAMLSRGLLGTVNSILDHFPSATDAGKLWRIYSKNVEPLYKFLHSPSTQILITEFSDNPSCATLADQCLLFAIYLLAIFSLNEDDCLAEFGQPRALLLAQFDYALRQALFNASWITTSQMSILLALVMYLSVVRRQSDPFSLWIWTGIGIRIMQRMGIHRDGEGMDLLPLDIELRRRLYWHLVSLDTYAGRISGTSDDGPPKAWTTRLPLNINDDQLQPDTAETPHVCAGATDMIFSLVRTKLAVLSTLESPNIQSYGPSNPVWSSTEKTINSVENEIETEFLRYCDPVEPVQALTLMLARAAIAAARLRQRFPAVAHQPPCAETERREIYELARRIIDSEVLTFTNPTMRPFEWYLRASFRWDALICFLVALAHPGFFAPEACDSGWERVRELFKHHTEILEPSNTLQRTVGRMTVKAWLANPPSSHDIEPEYIVILHTLHPSDVGAPPPRPIQTGNDETKSDSRRDLQGDVSFFDLDDFMNCTLLGADGGWDRPLDIAI